MADLPANFSYHTYMAIFAIMVTTKPLLRPRALTSAAQSAMAPARPVWAMGIFLSLSVAAAFQPISIGRSHSRFPKPHQHDWRPNTLFALTEPEVLVRQYAKDEDWNECGIEKIASIYSLPSGERVESPQNKNSKTSRNVDAENVHSRSRVKMKRVNSNKSQKTGTQGATDSSNKERVQFRGLSTTARRRPRSAAGVAAAQFRQKSSTMPGFAAESGRQRDFREGIRQTERRTGKKFVETEAERKRRKKEQGEAMYRNSASVPDSMVQFADEIHQEDRISRTEEIELGTKTQEAIRLQHLYTSLEESLAREPTDEEWCAAAGKINMEAIRQAIEDGLEAKNKLVTSNLRLVQSVVNTYIRNGLSGEYNAGDMMQDGIIALIRAAEKFEPDRGWKFSTYAMYWVRASVKRNQVAQTRVVSVPHRLYENNKKIKKIEGELMTSLRRRPTLQELSRATGLTEDQIDRSVKAMAQRGLSLDDQITNKYKPMSVSSNADRLVDILDTKSQDNEERKLESCLLREDLIEALNRYLTPEEVEILLFRYGLKELPESKTRIGGQPTIAELSRVLGLKPDKIRRTIQKSLKCLRLYGADEMLSYQRDLL
jgi:RNA polymerase primary sigma factor